MFKNLVFILLFAQPIFAQQCKDLFAKPIFLDILNISQQRDVTSEHQPFILFHENTQKNRPTFLLIHGLSESAKGMRPLAEKLYESGYDVIATTLKGHGSRPEDLQQIELKDWSQDLNFVLDFLKERSDNIYIAGYSTGGGLAFNLAMTSALSDSIKGLVLLSPLLGMSPSFESFIQKRNAEGHTFISDNLNTNPFAYASTPTHVMVLAMALARKNKQMIESPDFKLNLPIVIAGETKDRSVDMFVAHQLAQKTKALSLINEGDSHLSAVRPDNFNPLLQMINTLVNQIPAKP